MTIQSDGRTSHNDSLIISINEYYGEVIFRKHTEPCCTKVSRWRFGVINELTHTHTHTHTHTPLNVYQAPVHLAASRYGM